MGVAAVADDDEDDDDGDAVDAGADDNACDRSGRRHRLRRPPRHHS